MDKRSVSSNQKSTESCLSESWNIVGTRDVNNGSEGSDGESIEVIEEESQVDSYPKTVWESAIAEDAEKLDCPPSEESSLECEPYKNDDLTHSVNFCGFIRKIFRFCLVLFSIFHILLCIGSVIGLYLFINSDLEGLRFYKMQYMSPPRSFINGFEYQALLNQIKTYKEESQDLRGIVADLNEAVTSLKSELAYQNEKQNLYNFAEKNLKNENKLSDQLLNVQTKDSPTENESKIDVEIDEKPFRFIEGMLNQLTLGDENLEVLESVKLFYLIPKHLSTLSRHYSSNENIKEFIDFWKERLSVDNANLISDIREMRLKVIRHAVKRLSNIEKSFFKKLCNLQNINMAECRGIFTKPFEDSDIPQINKKLSDEQINNDEYAIKCESDCIESHDLNRNENFAKHNNLESQRKIEDFFSLNEDKKVPNEDKIKKLSEEQINTNQEGQRMVLTPSQSKKTNSASEVKGMDSDLGRDVCGQEDPSTNSFSSFSGASCESSAEDLQDQQWRERRTAESSWFLRLGQYRARLRRARGRRPHYLRKKGLKFRKPFFFNHRIYAKVYANDKEFMVSQGFL